ncbi:MAG: hypothetical protein AAGG01_19865, partial [Planctomycetota bacterium]
PASQAADRGPELRPDVVFVVDAAGQGDFIELQAAIDAAPPGAMLLMRPGDYGLTPITVTRKSLRIEGDGAGTVRIQEPIQIRGVSAAQEVSLGGLGFSEGFLVANCSGPVSFTSCTSLDNDLTAPVPAGTSFTQWVMCGSGEARHKIESSNAVSFVDCTLTGREGFRFFLDGTPGEHGLLVTDSTVALYGTTLRGGSGGPAGDGHIAYSGAGGDGLQASGTTTRVFSSRSTLFGGDPGEKLFGQVIFGCGGDAFRGLEGAALESSGPDSIGLHIDPLARSGETPSYTLTGPPGADIYLLVASGRSWREFDPSEGILHMNSGFQVIPLGTLPAGGVLSRPFPAPPAPWRGGFSSLELQGFARTSDGQDRYSEPRTLQVTDS